MKTIILFLILLTPLSLFAGIYPITITNSGINNDLVIIPTDTSFPCFSSPNGLSISGEVAVIAPQTTRIYTFTLPANILLECAQIISPGTGSSGGMLITANRYAIGTTVLNSTYRPVYGMNIKYQYTDEGDSYGIYPSGTSTPFYMSFSSNNHTMTVNADEIPPTE